MLALPSVVCIFYDHLWGRYKYLNVIWVTKYACYIGLFIIDPNGIVRQITINDLPVGRNVDEALRLVEAFKFTDVHGEGKNIIFKKWNVVILVSIFSNWQNSSYFSVCPAGWQKGADTIKPEVKASKEYFEKAN